MLQPTEYIAVYGSLRPGQYNHSNEEHIGQTTIRGYDLYPVGMGYPAIVPNPEGNNELVVDILKLTPGQKSGIDSMEIGAGYEIHPINIDIDGQNYYCHIYVYRPEYRARLMSKPRVESGDWVKFRKEAQATH